MQKKKGIAFLLLIVLVCVLVTGCGKKAELEKNSTIVKYKGGKIKAETLYEDLRDKYGISVLIDMIDHNIFDKKYKTTDDETKYVDNQISQMKSQYGDNDETFLAAVKQYLGVESIDELRNMISLEYKRNLAVEDYIKDNIKDDEIQKYYDEEVIGDMKVRHILIKPKTTDDMSTEEKEDAEKKAKEKAEKLIKKLDDGADFAKLAKEYSEDDSNKDKGGALGKINYGSLSSKYDELVKAAKSLKDGEYSTSVITTELGYHVILKVKTYEKDTLENLKDSIKETLAEKYITNNQSSIGLNALQHYRKEYKMEIQDDEMKKQYSNYIQNALLTIQQNNSSK